MPNWWVNSCQVPLSSRFFKMGLKLLLLQFPTAWRKFKIVKYRGSPTTSASSFSVFNCSSFWLKRFEPISSRQVLLNHHGIHLGLYFPHLLDYSMCSMSETTFLLQEDRSKVYSSSAFLCHPLITPHHPNTVEPPFPFSFPCFISEKPFFSKVIAVIAVCVASIQVNRNSG